MLINRFRHLSLSLIFLSLVIGIGSAQTVGSPETNDERVPGDGASLESVPLSNPRLGLEELFPPDRPLPPGIAEYLEPEASPALIDLSLEDTRVDLLLFGTWKSQLAQGFGIRWTPTERGTLVTTGPMAGLETIPFTNTVDLLLSLWIDAQFFVEINFRDEFEDNRFMIGFSALDPEYWLQKLWAGTHGIGVASGPLLPSLAVRDGSPGIVSSFRSNLGTHDLFMRIETRDPQVRTFLGNREIVENSLNAGATVRGRYFLLPYRIPVAATSQVRVWVESEADAPGAVSWESGTLPLARSAYFRPLNPGSDYLLSGPSGFLALSSPSRGMVIIELPDSLVPGSPGAEHLPFLALKPGLVGQLDRTAAEVEWNNTAGSDFENLILDRLDGQENPGNKLGVPLGIERIQFFDGGSRNGILLYDPGRFSPFEVLGYYPAPTGTGTSANTETESPLVPGLYQPGPAASGALGSEAGYSSLDLLTQVRDENLRIFPLQGSTAWAQRWPLEAVVAGGSFEYFTPSETRGSVLIPQFLSSESTTSTSVISLGKEFNPGSLSVTRTLGNQQSEARFRFDEETGQLILTPPPGTNELIRVTYSGNNPLGLDTAFTAGTQHQFTLLDTEDYTSTLDLGISGSIPFSVQETWQDPTTASSPASPMYTEGIVQFAIDGPAGWFKAQAQGRVQRPNSYDARHYLGVGSSFQSLFIDANRVGLGGVPSSTMLDGSDGTGFVFPTISSDNRAPILWAQSYPGSVADPLPLTSTNPTLPSAKASELDNPSSGIIEAGPYPVLATSGTGPQFSGIGYRADIVFEGTGATDSDETWAAFQMPIPLLQSGIPQEIALRWGAAAGADSMPVPLSPVHFYLQIGRLDEDSNNNSNTDGSLSSRPTASTGRGLVQVSGNNWQEEYDLGFAPDSPTEDLNRDRFLETRDSAPIQTFYLGTISAEKKDFRKPLGPEVARYIAEVAGSAGNVNWNYSAAEIRIIAVAQSPPTTDGDTLALSAAFGDLRLIYPRAGALTGESGASLTTSAGVSSDPPPYYSEVPGGSTGISGGYTVKWENVTPSTIGQSLWTLGVSTPDLPDYEGFGMLFYIDSGDYDLELRPYNVPGNLNLGLSTLTTDTGWYLLETNLNTGRWTFYQTQGTNPKALTLAEGSHSLPKTTQGITLKATHTTTALTPAGTFQLHQVTAFFPRTQASAQFVAEGRVETQEGFSTPGGLMVLGAPWIEGRITGQVSESPSLGTLGGSAGLTLLGVRTEILGEFQLDTGPQLTRAGHGLGLAGIVPWFSYDDRFAWVPQNLGTGTSGQAESSMAARIGPGDPWNIETTADVVRGSGGLQRTIDFELGFTLGAENQYATSTTLSHGQTALPRDFPFVNEYPKDWLEGYGLLDFVPRSLTDGRRYGLGTTHTFRPESGITLELGWKAEGSQALGNESPWVLGATQDIELSVGSDSDLSWSFAYSRRGSARSGGNDFLNLRADFSLLATRAALLPQALISLPLWDLVSPWEEDAFIAGLPQEFLSYFSEPRLSVTLRRRIGGTVADLYLPSFVALETARKTDTGVEAPPDQRSWAARVGFTPINMFGTQGLLPKSTTFSSDEYTLDLGWRTLSFGDSLRPIHGTTLALGARFYGLGRADLIQNQVQVPGLGSEYLPYTLSLSQSFDLTIADSYGLAANLKAGFPWSSPLPPTPETILPLTQNEEWQLVHNEGITFQVQGTWGSRSLGSDPESLGWFEEGAKNSDQGYLGSADFVPWSPSRPLSSMYLIHETILTLPYTGYFRGFVELGWRGTLTTGQEKWSHHIGGRIGVEILLEL